jgi:hypothetical protein
MDSSGEKTPRQLIQALYAAQNEGDLRALRAEIQGTHSIDLVEELVPGQATPEQPLVFDQWDDQEPVGSRPQAGILDLLYGGLALSLVVGDQEYCIAWKDSQFIFEIWHQQGETRTLCLEYDSLDDLLQVEGARPSFDLRAFVSIG